MRKKVSLIGGAVLALSLVCAMAQSNVVSQNIVGYVNLSISSGDNLIANVFSTGAFNDLNSVLTNGVPNGATFTEFDHANHQLLPLSIYDASATSWSINYAFAPDGTGGDLHSPDAATVTLVGSVIGINANGGNVIVTYVPPGYGPGTYLLGFPVPVAHQTFSRITGRTPTGGDSVEFLDPATQQLSTTTFNGTAWSNGDPTLGIGQAAYFNFAAPEPTPWALLIVGGVGLLLLRRCGQCGG